MKIVIPGDPIAKMRARYSQHGGFVRTYDPQHKKKEEIQAYVISYLAKNGISFDPDAIFLIRMGFYLPALKTWPESKKNAHLWGTENEPHRPDLDNMEKFYNDILNGIVYKDDCQILKLSSEKFYSLQPRTEIEIMEIPKWDLPEDVLKIYQNISPDEYKDLISDMKSMINAYEIFEDNDHLQKIEHFTSIASSLKKFSNKYSKKLSKISKISQDTDSH